MVDVKLEVKITPNLYFIWSLVELIFFNKIKHGFDYMHRRNCLAHIELFSVVFIKSSVLVFIIITSCLHALHQWAHICHVSYVCHHWKPSIVLVRGPLQFLWVWPNIQRGTECLADVFHVLTKQMHLFPHGDQFAVQKTRLVTVHLMQFLLAFCTIWMYLILNLF